MSYRSRSRTSYGNQKHGNSFGYHGNKNYNKLDNPTLLSNHAIDSVDSSDYQFVSHVDFPVIIKGKLSLTRNPWSIELESLDRLKPEQVIALCKQPIEIVMCDPLTKQPLRTFKVQKIADIKKELTRVNKQKPVEFFTGKQLCPYCLSDNMEETDTYVKCLDCGMGHNKSGRR